MPISRLEYLTPGYLLSTQKESSSRRRLKATSPRKFAPEHGYGRMVAEMERRNYHSLIKRPSTWFSAALTIPPFKL